MNIPSLMRSLRKKFFGGSAPRRKPIRRADLLLEQLESRTVPAITAPKVIAITPGDLSNVGASNPPITVQYNEAMDTKDQVVANYLLYNSAGAQVSISPTDFSYNPATNTATIDLSKQTELPVSAYTLFIRGDQVHEATDTFTLAQPGQLVVANAGVSTANPAEPGPANVSTINVANDGTLNAVSSYPLGPSITNPSYQDHPLLISLADFNGDGKLDVAVASNVIQPNGVKVSKIQIFDGKGAGQFAANPTVTLSLPGANPYIVAMTPFQASTVAHSNFQGPDLAVTDGGPLGDEQIVVFINRTAKAGGEIAFGAGTAYAPGIKNATLVGLVADDLDANGTTDLAVANHTVNGTEGTSGSTFDVYIYSGNGDGTFNAPRGKPRFSQGVAGAYVTLPGGAVVLIGAYRPNDLAAGPLDTNSFDDLAVAAQNGVVASYNQTTQVGQFVFSFPGDGPFDVPLGAPYNHVQLAPISQPAGSKVDDIVVSSNSSLSPTITVFHNSGGPTPSYSLGKTIFLDPAFSGPRGFRSPAADLNFTLAPLGPGGTGKYDIIVSFLSNVSDESTLPDPTSLYNPLTNVNDSFDVFANTSVGTSTSFAPPALYRVDNGPVVQAVGDINGDGIPDVVTANIGVSGDLLTQDNLTGSSFTVARGDGTGKFLVGTTYTESLGHAPGSGSTVPPSPNAVAVGDLNGDGLPDMVVTDAIPLMGRDQVEVYLATAPGVYAPPVVYSVQGPSPNDPTQIVGRTPLSVTLADLAGNGVLDIVTADNADNYISILMNDGTGHFTSTPMLVGVGQAPTQVVAGLFDSANGKRTQDLIVSHNGTGADPTNKGVTVLINGNGLSTNLADVVDAVQNTITVNTVPGLPTAGSFLIQVDAEIMLVTFVQTTTQITTYNVVRGVSGTTAATHATGATVRVLFLPALEVGSGYHATAVGAGDFNADGNQDIVLTDAPLVGPGSVVLLYGDGTGHFTPAVSTFRVAANPSTLVVSDVNRDGYADVIVGSPTTTNPAHAISTLVNILGDGFRPAIYTGLPNGISINSLAVTDFNNNLTTILANAVNDVQTTITVNTVPGAPTAGGFQIQVDSEVMLVTSVQTSTQTTTYTVVRGAGGTAAAAHARGSLARILAPDPYSDLVVGTSPTGDPTSTFQVVDNVYILHGVGDGTFVNPLPYEAGGPPTPAAVGVVSDPLVRLTTFFKAGTLVSNNLLQNGGFDTRDLSNEQGNLVGWQTARLPDSHGGWYTQTGNLAGSVSPLSQVPILPPDGLFQAMVDEPDQQPIPIPTPQNPSPTPANPNTPASYAGSNFLYQDVTIPASLATSVNASLTLSFRLVINNDATFYAPGPSFASLDFTTNQPDQQVRVDVMDPNAPITATNAHTSGTPGVYLFVNPITRQATDPAYITDQSTPLITSTPIFVIRDLTGLNLAGKTVRIRFAVVNNQGKLVAGVDDVSVQVTYHDVGDPSNTPTLSQPQLQNPGIVTVTGNIDNTTDSTIVGAVNDDGGVNNVASVAFDPNPSGGVFTPGDPNVFRTNYFDAQGHFSVALPNLPSGINTVALRVTDAAGNTHDATVKFNNEGPSLTVWQAVGPGPIDTTAEAGISYTSVSGRVTAVATDPSDVSGNTYYVGSANGGVWKTQNGGNSWTPLTDFLTDAAGKPIHPSIGALAVAPSDPNIVYAATGTGDLLPDSRAGIGILKSTNGGLLWGGLNGSVVGDSGTVLGGARITAMAVDQNNANIAYVAVAAGGARGPGVYRTLDGGQTWINILFPGSMALPAGTALASVTSLVVDPRNSEDVIIGLGNIGLVPASATAGVWQTSNATNPNPNWTRVLGGDNKAIQNNTLPSGLTVGRVTIAQGYGPGQNIATFYVLIGNPTSSTPYVNGTVTYGGEQGLYKSSDGLLNFTKVMLRSNVGTVQVVNGKQVLSLNPPNFQDVNLLGNDAANAGAMVIDPTNPNVVYVGGANTYASGNGGPGTAQSYGLVRIDTGNMRDVNWYLRTLADPSLAVPITGARAPDPLNNGDDLTKAEIANTVIPGIKAAGAYPTADGGGAYSGEGVSWYDLESDTYGPPLEATASVPTATPTIASAVAAKHPSRLPAQVRTLVIDPDGRLVIGTEEGMYRAVYHGAGFDFTSGGTGMVALANVLGTAPTASVDITTINGNLQIANLTAAAADPLVQGVYYASGYDTGTEMTTGGLNWVTMGVNGPESRNANSVPAHDAGTVAVATPNPVASPGTPTTVFRDYAYVNTGLYSPEISTQNGAFGSWGAARAAGISINDKAAYFPTLVVDPVKIFDSGLYQDVLLFGTDKVYTSRTTSNRWDQRSGVLSKVGGLITAAAISSTAAPPLPHRADVFYVGTDHGEIFVSTDNALTWPQVGLGIPGFPTNVPGAKVTGISVDPTNYRIAYVTFGGSGNYSHVWVTMDAGKTWAPIQGNLPNVPVYSVVTDPRAQLSKRAGDAGLPAPFGHLYVGTEVGAYVSLDRGATWSRLGVGLPNVPVVSMRLNTTLEQLVVATQGRGAFAISTDRIGPHVVSVSPGGPVADNPGLSSVNVTFNEAIDPNSFTPAQVDSILGPGNVSIQAISVKDVTPTPPGRSNPHNTFQITFPTQTHDGVYTFVIGPNITDVVGNPMDQNGNTINGEVPGDEYTFQVAVNSTDDGHYITGLYHDLLGRQSDTGGFLSFLNQIEPARFAQLKSIASAFAQSTLARTQLIQDLYSSSTSPLSTLGIGDLLGQPATQQEVNVWLSQLQQGLPTETMIDILVASDAYFAQNRPGHVVANDNTNFVNQLYLDLFQRTAGSNEVTLFVNQLAGGEANARTQIATSLVNSPTFYTNFINNTYNEFLKRNPSPAETSSWLGALNGGQGVTEEQLIATLMGTFGPGSYFSLAPSILQASGNSNNYSANEAFVRAAYLQLLPGVSLNPTPGADPNVNHWVGQLDSHAMTTTQVAYTLVTSDTYRFDPTTGIVAQYYASFLPSVTVTPDIINAWRPYFAKGGRTENFEAILIGSSAYYSDPSKGAGTDTGWINSAWNDIFQVSTGAPAGQVTSIGNYLGAQRRVARQQVAATLTSSSEFQNRLVTRVYNNYLHRDPSQTELAAWHTILSAPPPGPNVPTREEQLLAGVLGGQEYFYLQTDANGLHTDASWVNSLYPSLRISDNSGAPIILSNLINAYAPQRLLVANEFLHSAEYRTVVIKQDYVNLLNRQPTAGELAYWQSAFQNGATQEQIIAALMGNASVADPPGQGDPLEFFKRSPAILGLAVSPNNDTFVKAVYFKLFPGYEPTQDEVNGWTQMLKNKTISLQGVAQTLATSNRYFFDPIGGLITRLYLQYIGRAASPAELTAWKNAYANGARDEDVIAALVSTSTYLQEPHLFP